MGWLEYLRTQRAKKLEELAALETGEVQLFESAGGKTRDITAERVSTLKSDIAEIRLVFMHNGVAPEE